MASTGRGGRSPAGGPAVVPETMAQVLPTQTPMIDHSFTLQAIMELQRSVAELATKTDRLVKDVESQSGKLDAVRHQIAYARGAFWIAAAVVTMAVGASTFYLRSLPPAYAPAVQQAQPLPSR